MNTVLAENPQVIEENTHIVPLSLFNQGKAGEVFEEVRRSGTKLVIDDRDDSAVCIIMKPEDYMKMSDDYNEIALLAIAEDRLKHFDESKLIPAEEVYKEFGITQEDIDSWEDVELE